MLGFGSSNHTRELEAMLQAIGKSQAVIEFNVDGTIITANENFLKAMGYSLAEIEGQHHRMFVEPGYANSAEYQNFWAALGRGEFQAAVFKRITKSGREIFIQASYNPILDKSGKPFKVVKFATDVTKETLRNADYAGQLDAIGKAQAVIEFQLDGTIITANENFLKTMGYTLAEVQGKHHSMFAEPAYRDSPEYKAFWAALGRGEFQAAEYKRIAKGGREVFIQASYNPIFDMTGKPFKVVKFATDITQDKLRNADYIGQIDAIGKSQAVIEFNLDGTIITANSNFLGAMGYSLNEIQGKHHSMFVEPSFRDSAEYAQFWASLGRGEFQSAEYKRIAKGGREIYIQASYNPILDMNGKPFKVVKYASDVTQQVIARKKSEHVRSMMESVAAGAEELNASVKEIAESMVKSKDTANGAAERVELADHSTHRLNEAAQSMGGIVELINNITSQIDLLALNATIESARAGEAGRGFAVVANEVKNLAGQAKNATEQISKEIDGMRGISTDVVTALGNIKQSIEAVREYVTSTAAAVEEQSAVANEMSANMQKAAAEANSIGQAA
jgi:methyl-accepting chemotaxis protein